MSERKVRISRRSSRLGALPEPSEALTAYARLEAIQPLRTRAVIAGYNAQIAVDGAHQISVAQRLQTSPADARALPGLLADIRLVLHANPQEVSGPLPLAAALGSGRAAIADGTHVKLRENNLLGSRHIRYGGYGGIAYHHIGAKTCHAASLQR